MRSQTSTPRPRRQHRFRHNIQERGRQADSALRRQLGQQHGERQVNVILRHDDVQRAGDLESGHARLYNPVNDQHGARGSSTADERSNLLRWHDGVIGVR